jgi:hypothetical protein
MNFRAAPGIRIDWVDTRIESGFSNFLFIDRRYRSHPVLRRIFSIARVLGYQSLLIERLEEGTCSLLAEENAALGIRRSDFLGSVVHRLTFWCCAPDAVVAPADFIGYAIFKTDQFKGASQPQDHVYESVLPSVRLEDQNNFIHCRRSYVVQTPVGLQTVTGVLYAQQNDLTFVCAHVALRTALACLLPDADLGYGQMNGLAGIDHRTRVVGGGQGLSPDDLQTILRGLGVPHEKIVHEPKDGLDLPTEFQRDLYGFIESGCPALVGFELEDPNPPPGGSPRHIVPVIGHTFNNDAWVPDAQRAYFGNQLRYFSSESWLSSYVLHDDNFGPYYCLPRHFLKKDNFRIILGLQRHATAYSAGEAEAVGFDFLQSIVRFSPSIGQDWYDRFGVFCRQGLLVLRSLLVDRTAYLRHLREIRSWNGAPLETDIISQVENHLPERFWMIEASAPELFNASRRKFGELLLSATLPLPRPLDISPLLAARLPGMVLMPQAGNIVRLPTGLQSHTPLFTAEVA